MKSLNWTLLVVFFYSNNIFADINKAKEAYKNRNYNSAIIEFELEAKNNNRDAFYHLGLIYGRGDGIERDFSKALKWLQKAADAGHKESQFMVSNLYRKGQGTEPSMNKAVEYALMAAKQNHAAAQNNLGLFYLQGLGVDKDLKKGFEWTYKSAKAGYADAQNTLSGLYASGTGVEINQIEAQKWVRKAAAQGHKPAQKTVASLDDPKNKRALVKLEQQFYQKAQKGDVVALLNMATINANGIGVPANLPVAARYYQLAANSGNAIAQFELAKMYRQGLGVKKDPASAFIYFFLADKVKYVGASIEAEKIYFNIPTEKRTEVKKSALDWFEKNNSYAKYNYDNQRLYQVAQGVLTKTKQQLKNDERVIQQQKLLAKANTGDKNAQFDLAVFFHNQKNKHSESIKWYTIAANNGHAKAAHRLGVEYFSDGKVSKDVVKAVAWFKKASVLDFTAAQKQLGDIYFTNKYGLQNYKQAFKYYSLAAKKNNPFAIYNIGKLYLHGYGVEKNFNTALSWFIKASKLDDGFIQFRLGKQYQKGSNGFPRDTNEALSWYRKSAYKNYSSGQSALAEFLSENPMGAEMDIEAYKFFLLSKRYLTKATQSRISILLKRRLSSAQIAKAKSQAKTWEIEHKKN